MFQKIRFGALICPSPRVGNAKRIVVASGLGTLRPFDSVTADGPNCGSAAAIRVTIGPLYGPDKKTRLLPKSRPHGPVYAPPTRSACFCHDGLRVSAVPDNALVSLPRMVPMPLSFGNALGWMYDAGSPGIQVPSRCCQPRV